MRSKLSPYEERVHAGIRKLVRTIGVREFVTLVAEEVKSQAAQRRLCVNEYLDQYKARGDYRRGFDMKTKKVKSFFAGAKVIAKLRLPIHLNLPMAPWDRLKKGSVVVVVVGDRPVKISEAADSLESRAVGKRDFEAHTLLLTMLGRELPVGFRVDVLQVNSDCPDAEAQRVLKHLYARKEVGGVVVVGSPVVNPVADPIAREMLDGNEDLLPGKFRWSHPIGKRSTEESPPFLWEAQKCAPSEEGFRLRRHDKTTYPRVPDSIILNEIRERKRKQGTKARPLRNKFKDCGLVIIDCRNRSRPILVLLAGHGGCGTVAATLGLRDYPRVTRALQESVNPERAIIGEDRMFGVVEVDRRKPTLDPVDDLDFDFEKGNGWDWVV